MRLITILGLCLLMSSQMATAASLEPLLQAAGLKAMTTSTAADFELPDVAGRTLRLSDQRGKVVFLNFWATWCPPCIAEMPMFEEIHQALRQRPFVMWAVNLREGREEVARFMQENRLHFPALLDLEGSVTSSYRVLGLPSTYLIDCSGTVVGQAVGPRPWDNEETRALLAALLSDDACG